ncbi:methyltransferase domain-containing protein [Pseudovibrio sp. Tun.PSC04-5.I4]|uniref:methyltransferase domain-containing protein n=1 Tax=Pseudovibrio sp. Tun.PSC04-5.I4 TaxID=1798213 RepID=UPI00088D95C3|nr:methyltransferase domain-containing protein [Pseudovibrio sp. Tun.PSC04-5.I4]SDQ72908.1 Methyltransferase domain-containing protein [Pseudovibrio sp. Tun.PSC04-5.I4]
MSDLLNRSIGHLKNIRKDINKFKRVRDNYDKYAGFMVRVRRNAPEFQLVDDLSQHWTCCKSISGSALEVASYPFVKSEKFARLLHVRCTSCGMTFVPFIDFDLDAYYAEEYQENVQPFRTYSGEFYHASNPFYQSPTFERMRQRAKKHLDLLEHDKAHSILDIGCGVGVTLRESKSLQKFADEPDPYSQKILGKELGVNLVKLEQLNEAIDHVIASHIIEHLYIGELPAFFGKVHKALKPGGKLLVEVPDGADQIHRLRQGNRDNILYEPHTISFSGYGLAKYIREAGFHLKIIVPGISFDLLSHDLKNDLMRDAFFEEGAGIILLAEKI